MVDHVNVQNRYIFHHPAVSERIQYYFFLKPQVDLSRLLSRFGKYNVPTFKQKIRANFLGRHNMWGQHPHVREQHCFLWIIDSCDWYVCSLFYIYILYSSRQSKTFNTSETNIVRTCYCSVVTIFHAIGQLYLIRSVVPSSVWTRASLSTN